LLIRWFDVMLTPPNSNEIKMGCLKKWLKVTGPLRRCCGAYTRV